MQSPDKGLAECKAYIRGCEPPERWGTTLPDLWQEPTDDTVLTALERLDPQSSPGLDGIPALLYQMYPGEFCPRMLQHVKEMREKGTFQDGWSQGIMRSLPKEPGNLSVEKQRPVILLNTRAKWATMILKLGMDDYLRAIIPMAQRGFVLGRSMDGHLHEVEKRFRGKGRQAAG